MDTTVNTTVASIVRCLGYVTGKQDIASVKWGGNQIHVTRPVFRVGMVQIVLSNVVQTATAVTDLMVTVSLDVNVDGMD